MKHYGSTAIKYTGSQIIAFATCSCGWKSNEEECELNELDEGYEIRDVVRILGALTEIELNIHLEGAACESFDD